MKHPIQKILEEAFECINFNGTQNDNSEEFPDIFHLRVIGPMGPILSYLMRRTDPEDQTEVADALRDASFFPSKEVIDFPEIEWSEDD